MGQDNYPSESVGKAARPLSGDNKRSSMSMNRARLALCVTKVCSMRDHVPECELLMQPSLAADADLGFELCYLEASGAERREFPVSWPGLCPEAFAPVREFRWTRGQRHLPGLWWSATTGSHVGYGSWLEVGLVL